MHLRKYSFLIPILLGVGILVAGLVLMWPTSSASAQCGSQASSCKNCHETQGKDPVNNDGTGWHQSHAFGDFCYMCHAGNNQSMDEAAAHAGMVPPLSDTKAACQSCHPDDLDARVQVYASILGVQAGSGGASPAGDNGAGSTPAAPAGTTGSSGGGSADGSSGGGAAPTGGAAPAAPGMVVGLQENVVDYNQRYDETVLGKRLINWGNLIVIAMIIGLLFGGGAFVIWNERKLRGIGKKAKDRRPKVIESTLPVRLEDYSPEVLALLPRLARLDPTDLHALKRLLENPEQASELLHGLSRLDPELVRRIRTLDRNSRALLLALAGD